MATVNDNTAPYAAGSPAVPQNTAGTPIKPDTLSGMLQILDELVEHTHLYYDDYGTACQCNCNCNCNCTRGGI